MPWLLVAVAAAHALIAGLARAAILAGLDLDGMQRAIIAVTAMIGAAGNAAADVGIGFLFAHGISLLNAYFVALDTHSMPVRRREKRIKFLTSKAVDISPEKSYYI